MAIDAQDAGRQSVDALAKPEDVVGHRNGDVLIKHTLLKADHFPGCQNMKLTPLLDGAPNFRQVEGLPVYGVAIPTTRGLRNVLDAVGATHGQRKVLWHSMREEPLIYINGKPYVVREADQPFANLEYTGIDRSRVEDMEARLKQDVLKEARRFDNCILVSEESDDMQVIDVWEPVTAADVQTPLEVYAELVADGYDIDYLRVPVTDEKAPKDSDFELLIQRLWRVPEGAALVFNCQMGRGRTTTGMIIASLLALRRAHAFPAHLHEMGGGAAAGGGGGGGGGGGALAVPGWFASAPGVAAGGSPTPPLSDKLKGGMYGVIRSLLRVLERGNLGKAVLDAVVDACSAMQNLREAIGSYRARLLSETKEHKRAVLMGVCLEYLERYYMLLAFTSYLTWPRFDPGSSAHISFQEWMGSRPELRSILLRMLRRNPMAALELHIPAMPPGTPVAPDLPAAEAMTEEASEREDKTGADLLRSQAEEQASTIVEQRSGAVLGPDTILKEDYFPGMKSSRLPQAIPGASNFRTMVSCNVFGVAMSTVEGIRRVLQAVTAPRPGREEVQEVLWFNMREEPVLYINGLPYVLREVARPMKNLQEYAGIDAKRLERMEGRLKADVLAEAARYGGRILVGRESLPPSSARLHGELVDTWEEVQGPGAVQTPAEVYAMLRGEGHPVAYCRVPVTDGRAPHPEDMDVILDQMRQVGFDQPVVFNCQLGAGRTTTGMVVAGLLHIMADAQLLRSASSSRLDDMDLPRLQEELQGNSPKSEDDERDDEIFKGPDVWDLTPEEVEEQRSLAAGGYVGVRRVVRMLEGGDSAKHVVDAAIDANSQMLNLRISIMRYRKPRSSLKGLKSEVHQRHAAFSRGAAYLERYCLLIAFASYLEHVGVRGKLSFARWLTSRPELQQALAALHSNPAAALAAVPVTCVPVVYHGVEGDGGQGVSAEEQDRVLSKRRGRTLTRRIILKSYISDAACPLPPPPHPHTTAAASTADAMDASDSELGADVRCADGLPIFTVGNVNVEQLRRLLSHLGAGPSGHSHVVLTDVREELVVYVNGTPYIRRELEMPAAALHHAGIHQRQLEQLEQLLKEDVRAEAQRWGGRLLLHQEVPPEDAARHPSLHHSSSGGILSAIPPHSAAPLGVVQLFGSFLTPPTVLVLPEPLARPKAAVGAVALSTLAAGAAAAGGGVGSDGASRGVQPSVVAAAAVVPMDGVEHTGVALVLPVAGAANGSGHAQQQQQQQQSPDVPPAAMDMEFPGFRPHTPPPQPSAADATGSAQQQQQQQEQQQQPLPPGGLPTFPITADCSSSGAAEAARAHSPFASGTTAAGSSPAVFAAAAGTSTSGSGNTTPPGMPTTLTAHSGGSGSGAHPGLAPINTTAGVASNAGVATNTTNGSLLRARSASPAPRQEDVTAPVDVRPGAAVAPFWERVDLAAAAPEAGPAAARTVLATCRDVAGQLVSEGFQISYSRIPLSRERTPEAGNLQDIHSQLLQTPSQPGRSLVHLVLSRTSTGSSARFVAAALCCYTLVRQQQQEEEEEQQQQAAAAAASAGGLRLRRDGSPVKRMRRTMSDLGEYRGIMALSRLLPHGMEVKHTVDAAINRCAAVGNLREDVQRCKHIAAASPAASSEDPLTAAWAARQLGVHYLKRYFLLIAFACFLEQQGQEAQQARQGVGGDEGGYGAAGRGFARWIEDRRELDHLLNHLTLDT